MHLLPGATPAGVAAVRMLVGALGFAVLSGRGPLRWAGIVRRGPRSWLLVTIVASVLTQWTFLVGMAWAGVATGAVLHMGLCPVFTAAVERLSGKRCLTWSWVVATGSAVAGCAALVLDAGRAGGAGGAQDARWWIGVSAAVFSSLAYALFTVAGSRVIEAGHPAGTVMSLVFAGTAVGLAPVLLVAPITWVATGRGVLAALFFGLVATTLAYHLFGVGLRHLPASAVSTLVLAEPVTASVVAVVVLGERIGPLGIAGLVAVAVSLGMVVRGPRPRPVRLSTRQAEMIAGLLTSAGRYDARPAVEDVAAFLGATARAAARTPDHGGLDPEHLWWRVEAWAAALDHENCKERLAKT